MAYLVLVPHEGGCMLQEHVSRLLDVDPWGKRKQKANISLLSHLSRTVLP
jgi:hypothetical protein